MTIFCSVETQIKSFKCLLGLLLGLFLCNTGIAQMNVIVPDVLFVSLNANAQSVATGGVGVVASDLYTQNGLNQNPAILARADSILGFQALNFVPWNKQIPEDFAGLRLFESAYYQSFRRHAIGFAARYMRYNNEIALTDITGNFVASFRPIEYFTQINYAYRFSSKLSLGVGLKYIRSNLTGGNNVQGFETKTAQALAGDFGLDYRKYLRNTDRFKLKWNVGFSILNLGNRVSYLENNTSQDFLPQTMKLGTLLTFIWKAKNKNYLAWDVSYQANKLLVPTPPQYAFGAGGFIIEKGLDPNVSAMRGVLQSFYDAPNGFREELNEIIHQFGTEIRGSIIDNKLLIAARAGYFLEHETKGAREILSIGLGIGYRGFQIDVARPFHRNLPYIPHRYILSVGARFNLTKGARLRFVEN